MKNDAYIGYLKYSGQSVENGCLDAKKTAEALIGFDQALRYFVENDVPELKGKSFEIPIRIRAGSWEALIPTTIGQWITTAFAIVATAYLTGAASKLAEKDFKDKGLLDVFRSALRMLQWIIRLGIHLKGVSVKAIKNIRWEDNNETVLLPDINGKYIRVPREVLQKYIQIPPKFLSKMARLIQADREMEIGVIENGTREEVRITISEKYFFTDEEADLTDAIFPELAHGQMVELIGEITRGNEKTNSIGLEYNGHILSCSPEKGSIVAFKEALFIKCKVIGVINRVSESGLPDAKKPRIIFSQIIPLKQDDDNPKLFQEGS
jgi:hypothetical protein